MLAVAVGVAALHFGAVSWVHAAGCWLAVAVLLYAQRAGAAHTRYTKKLSRGEGT